MDEKKKGEVMLITLHRDSNCPLCEEVDGTQGFLWLAAPRNTFCVAGCGIARAPIVNVNGFSAQDTLYVHHHEGFVGGFITKPTKRNADGDFAYTVERKVMPWEANWKVQFLF